MVWDVYFFCPVYKVWGFGALGFKGFHGLLFLVFRFVRVDGARCSHLSKYTAIG